MTEVSRYARKISSSYLGWDGVFVLRLIEHNHGSIMATLIVSRLWEFYAKEYGHTLSFFLHFFLNSK